MAAVRTRPDPTDRDRDAAPALVPLRYDCMTGSPYTSWEAALGRDDPRTIARISRPARRRLEMAWPP
jgi:hypothetical protein